MEIWQVLGLLILYWLGPIAVLIVCQVIAQFIKGE